MKQIELQYTDEVTIDLLDSIIRERFPNNKIWRQNWGIYSPFILIKMSFWIKLCVAVVKKPKKGKTIVIVNDQLTTASILILGLPAIAFRKNFRTQMMNVIRDGLRQRTNVVFLNNW